MTWLPILIFVVFCFCFQTVWDKEHYGGGAHAGSYILLALIISFFWIAASYV